MEKIIKKTYIWYYDKKIIGMIIVAFSISFQVFAFLKIHFLSSIHGYTVGMLLGLYNPFFYVFMTYAGLNIISEGKFKLPQWFKLKSFSYWIFALSIIFISVSSSYYQGEIGDKNVGTITWNSFDKWYEDFTSNKNAWFPTNTNGGILGFFMYSFSAMIISGIGAFIFSIIMIFISTSYVVIGSVIGFHKLTKLSKQTTTKQILINKKQEGLRYQDSYKSWNYETDNVNESKKPLQEQPKRWDYEFYKSKNKHKKLSQEQPRRWNYKPQIKSNKNNKDNDSFPFEDPF